MRLRRSISAVVAALVGLYFGALAASAEQPGRTRTLATIGEDFYTRFAVDPDQMRQQHMLAALMGASQIRPRKKRRSLDLTPLAELAIGYAQGLGLPLIEHRDAKGRRPVAVSASFAIADDMPDVKFHLGDRPAEPMGAFYPSKKGFRFSVVYPIKNLTLRLDAGDDSEFGSAAVMGLSWVHPSKKFAAGFGLPVKRKNAESDFGAIFQFRMKLD